RARHGRRHAARRGVLLQGAGRRDAALMTCACHCASAVSAFDAKRADSDRKRYERKGPDPTTRLLLAELRSVTRAGDTLLDGGGGVGVIGLERASAGLGEVVHVEAAPAFLAMAQRLFAEGARPARFRQIPGDFAELTPRPTGDLVTLDRVVCCYPDMRGLLTA